MTEGQNAELNAELEMWKSMSTDASHDVQQQQPVPHHSEQHHVDNNNHDTVDALLLEISQMRRMLEVHVLLKNTVFTMQ